MDSSRFPRGRPRGNPLRPNVPQNQGAPRPQGSRPQTQRQEAPRPQTQTAPRPQTQTAPRPQTQTAPRPQTQTAPRPQTQTAPRPQAQTAIRPQAQTAIRPQAQTVIRPQAQIAIRPQAQRAPRPQAQRAPRPQAQRAPRPQTQNAPSLPLPGQGAQSSDLNQQVEQVTQGIGNISTEKTIILGQGKDSTHKKEKFVIPRPSKSKGTGGKQGTSGTAVKLYGNYFPITSYTDWVLYQYRVDFSPEEDRIGVKKGLLSVHRERLGAYIFDGTMLFSSILYNPNTINLVSKRSQDDQIINITIVFTTVLESCHYAHIQVFNLILRNCLRGLELQQVGRNFYDANAQISIPDYKLVLWPGYETSIGIFDSGLLMRNDISTKVLRQDTVYDLFMECVNSRHNNSNWFEQFKAGIIGQVVMTRYNNETYRVDDVDDSSNIDSTFVKKDGTVMSYNQYYSLRWNIVLRDTFQPLLISKKKKCFTTGTQDLIYLVPELCTMTGFSESMRNNFNIMKAVANHTCIGPTNRISRYYSFIKRVKDSNAAMESLTRWRLNVNDKLIEIKGRVLEPEKIFSGIDKNIYTGGAIADWSKSVRKLPMFKTVSLNNWVLVSVQENIDLDPFVRNLIKVSSDMGFALPQPEIIYLTQGLKSYPTVLKWIVAEKNPPFIMCLLPTSRSDIYSLIKKYLCVDRAVPSQVVLNKHVIKINMSVLTKIAIQINCKLGGAPWSTNIPLKKFMIVGFDVCHDKQNKGVSYGAVVVSTNDSHSSFFSCVQKHEDGQELSVFFGSSMAKALDTFVKLNDCFPKGIIVYRDGVGDGQLTYVYQTEVLTIKETCLKFCGKQNPMLVFIVVKKRICTRFFLEQSDQSVLNPFPGTIVDSVVTDPSMYDFFLVSQNVKFGTVTPTHYNIIEDTSTITVDHIQRRTYKLTHMYFNWSGTVSVPAVCQLAHKLAFLTAQTLGTSPNSGLDKLLYFL